MKIKSNKITPFATRYNFNNKYNAMDAEWVAATQKLKSTWSRLRLSNEDVETILKIAAKLP